MTSHLYFCVLLLRGIPYFIYFGYGNHLISNVTTALHKHSNRIANSNMSNMNFYGTESKEFSIVTFLTKSSSTVELMGVLNFCSDELWGYEGHAQSCRSCHDVDG